MIITWEVCPASLDLHKDGRCQTIFLNWSTGYVLHHKNGKLCYLCAASDDSRKTHISSRCHVLRDRTNRHSSPALSQPSHEDTNAWQCVDAQHGFNTSLRACQAEVCHIHNMRKHHEERTAKACSQHDKVNQGGAFYYHLVFTLIYSCIRKTY